MRTEQILTRLTPEEKAAVEALQRRLMAANPGVNITLSDVMRHAICIASSPAAYPADGGPIPDFMGELDLTSVETSEPAAPTAPKRRKGRARAA